MLEGEEEVPGVRTVPTSRLATVRNHPKHAVSIKPMSCSLINPYSAIIFCPEIFAYFLFVLFDLILYVPVNNFSVMSGLVFLG